MPQCFVVNCGNYYNRTKDTTKVIYHILPSSPRVREKWMQLCGYDSNGMPVRHARVCSDHFTPDSYCRDLRNELLGLPPRKKLRSEAMPNKKLPVTSGNKKVSVINNVVNVTDSVASSRSAQVPPCSVPAKVQTVQKCANSPSNENVLVISDDEGNSSRQVNKKRRIENIIRDLLTESNTQPTMLTKEVEVRSSNVLKTKNTTRSQCASVTKCGKNEKNKKGSKLIPDLKTVKVSPAGVVMTRRAKTAMRIKTNQLNIKIFNSTPNNRLAPNFEVKSLKQGIELLSQNYHIDKETVASVEKSITNITQPVPEISTTNIESPGPKSTSTPKMAGKKLSPPKGKIKEAAKLSSISKTATEQSSSDLKSPVAPEPASVTTKRSLMSQKKNSKKRTILRVRSSRRIQIAKGECVENKLNLDLGDAHLSEKLKFLAGLELRMSNAAELLVQQLSPNEQTKSETEQKCHTPVTRENIGNRLHPQGAPTSGTDAGTIKSKGKGKTSAKGEDPQDSLNKMRIMEDVKEGCDVQPSSPGHAEQRTDDEKSPKENTAENGVHADTNEENGQADATNETTNEKSVEVPKEEEMSPENDVDNEEKADKNSDSNHVNEETFSDASSSENQSNKRKHDTEDVAIKKLRLDLQENFASRDKILTEFMEISECSNVDQIQIQSENILAEIRMLNDVAREKEREWNNVIHLKKLKEELLLRLQRRKQILQLNDKNVTDTSWDAQNDSNGGGSVKNNSSNQSILKANLSNPAKSKGDKNQNNRFRNILPRPQTTAMELNGSLDYRTAMRQRPVLDVQSIIADYRQRHPETVPRRGRRIRNNNNSDANNKSSNGVMNFSSLTFGSGAQVRHNADVNNELGLLLSALEGNRQDGSRPVSADSTQVIGDSNSFRDMLVNFARLSQSERNELIQNAIKPPPPYPEVTVHPVPPATTSSTSSPSNSLLHGILTKSPAKSNGSKSSFSPTLARLLTAPERGSGHSASTTISSTVVHPGNVSISEILATSKARNEITITPVGSQYDNPASKNRPAQMDEEEAEDSADRLVIDESTEGPDARKGDNGSDVGDEVPQCQGCNQKAAQFVCAGCGNQWYCSRDCQVSAWDEHSEVCSG